MFIRRRIVLSALLCLICAKGAAASGFAIQEQSVRNQGAAFAGAGANPQDASTIFYNPAGMVMLDDAQGAAGVGVLMPHAQYSDRGSTGGLNAGAQAAYGGVNTSDAFSPVAVPNFYAATPLGDDMTWVGLGVTMPFGLENKYDGSSFVRYDSTSSTLTVVDIAPVVAILVADDFSIGGGPDIQMVSGQLDNALPCPGGAVGCGAAFSPATDGLTHLDGNGWRIGYNLGAQWQATKRLRLGATYRSAMTHSAKGTVRVSGLAGGLAALNGLRDAAAELKLPSSAGLSAAYDWSNQLKLLGSVNWTGWSSFDAIRVTFALPVFDSVTPENYKDSWMGALGAEWKQDERWTFRGGLQYDQTPTNAVDRSSRTPDSDRYWISGGASYAINKRFSLDAAYSHLFMPDAPLALTRPFYSGGAASTVHINGVSKNSADIVSLQVKAKFN
jgi:long-chain fatty acid transport protein